VEPPPGFHGRCAPYQCEGLGWLHFLQQFRFAALPADDMGLGKTIQVLALLEERRVLRAASASADRLPPSLVVMPRSCSYSTGNRKPGDSRLIFASWNTPEACVFGGTNILMNTMQFSTTYGTLRRDAPSSRIKMFDYLILDEAQAIKNASTESAKAARLLRGSHRLALSGTPIENHWVNCGSLFEFLKSGMLDRQTFSSLERDPAQKSTTTSAHCLPGLCALSSSDEPNPSGA